MEKILKEIEELKLHAKSALKTLAEKEYDSVREELQKILRIDIRELRELHSKGGSQAVIEECKEVLRDAKKALYTLKQSKWEFLHGLIIQIYYILNHEEAEEIKFEKEEDQLYNIWERYYKHCVIYHGMSTIGLGRARRYGLVPSMKPWDQHDFDEASRILKPKRRFGGPYEFEFDDTGSGLERNIFLSGTKEWALYYAVRRKVESLHDFILRLHSELVINERTKRMSVEDENIIRRIYQKYEHMWRESRPILLHISIEYDPNFVLPNEIGGIRISFGDVLDYDKLKKKFEGYQNIRPNSTVADFLSFFKLSSEDNDPVQYGINCGTIMVDRRIPSKYIKKIEYI